MPYNPVERARREKIRYHKAKQAFLNAGGVMPSKMKKDRMKQDDGEYTDMRPSTAYTSSLSKGFSIPPPKPKPELPKRNKLEKAKPDVIYEGDAIPDYGKQFLPEPIVPKSKFSFYSN